MAFYMRNYTSEEKFDISKFMDYKEGVYDVIDAPLLNQLKQLPIVQYYYVNEGYHDIDLISSDVYGTPFLAYLIQFYNGDFRDTFPEDTVLNLFSMDNLNDLYNEIVTKSNINKENL